jgi:hypothetical protein
MMNTEMKPSSRQEIAKFAKIYLYKDKATFKIRKTILAWRSWRPLGDLAVSFPQYAFIFHLT